MLDCFILGINAGLSVTSIVFLVVLTASTCLDILSTK